MLVLFLRLATVLVIVRDALQVLSSDDALELEFVVDDTQVTQSEILKKPRNDGRGTYIKEMEMSERNVTTAHMNALTTG